MKSWVRNLAWCGLGVVALACVALQVLASLTRPGREEAMNRLRTRLVDSAHTSRSQVELGNETQPNIAGGAAGRPQYSVEEVREKAGLLIKAFRDRTDWSIAENRQPVLLLASLINGSRNLRDLTDVELDVLAKSIETDKVIREELDDLDWHRLHDAMIDADTRAAAFFDMWDLALISERLLITKAVLDAHAGSTDALLLDAARLLCVSEVSVSRSGSPLSYVMSVVASALEEGGASRDAEDTLLTQLAQSRRREVFRRQQEQMLSSMVKLLDELPQSLVEWENDLFRRTLGLGYCTVGLPLFNYDVQIFATDAARVLDASSLPHLEAEEALGDIRAGCDARFLGSFGRNLGVGPLSDPDRFLARAEQEAWMDITRLGIILERYRTEHSTYPQTLNALQDRFPEGLPVDPFSGGPYTYTFDGQSFQLSSGDIVWRSRSKHEAVPGDSGTR